MEKETTSRNREDRESALLTILKVLLKSSFLFSILTFFFQQRKLRQVRSTFRGRRWPAWRNTFCRWSRSRTDTTTTILSKLLLKEQRRIILSESSKKLPGTVKNPGSLPWFQNLPQIPFPRCWTDKRRPIRLFETVRRKYRPRSADAAEQADQNAAGKKFKRLWRYFKHSWTFWEFSVFRKKQSAAAL